MSDEIIPVLTHGRVGPHRESHEERLLAHNFLADGVTPVAGFLEWNGAAVMGEHWGMDNNGPQATNPAWATDGLGDCGAAMTDHYNMAKQSNKALYNTLGNPLYAGTMATYFAYGLAQGEVGQLPAPPNEPDYGVSNQSWFAFLYKMGLIKGYGEVVDQYGDWFAQTFKGLCVGQGLDGMIAGTDFDASPRIPWDSMDMPDGHDTLTIITHTDGSGACVTWGSVQPYTASYRQTNWQDRWVIFDEDDPNVNWPALQAALTEIHGVVTPPTPVTAGGTADPWDAIERHIRAFFKGAVDDLITDLRQHKL